MSKRRRCAEERSPRKKKSNSAILSYSSEVVSNQGDGLSRCFWAAKSERNRLYHDLHWGSPIRQDHQLLFEILSLCSQQAGVSWFVVWNKRSAYRKAFHDFDLQKVACMNESDVDRIIETTCDAGGPGCVMRNRRKLLAIVNNAKICLEIHNEFEGGLAAFLWSFVPDSKPIVNDKIWTADASPLTESPTSKAMAKRFKELGFSYLGSVTLHAFAQQCGLLNDHCASCYKNPTQSASTAPRGRGSPA